MLAAGKSQALARWEFGSFGSSSAGPSRDHGSREVPLAAPGTDPRRNALKDEVPTLVMPVDGDELFPGSQGSRTVLAGIEPHRSSTRYTVRVCQFPICSPRVGPQRQRSTPVAPSKNGHLNKR